MLRRYRDAFALSKEEVQAAQPAGTVTLVEHSPSSDPTSRDDLRLVPQPSRDPADPLNWAPWRKAGALAAVSFLPFVANYTASIVGSTLPVMVMAFGRPVPFGKLSHLVAVNVLFLGVANIWWVPLANTFGRRPILLLSTLLLFCTTIWCAVATSFESLLVARIFQGIGGAPADTVAPDIVGEIFFAHQAGRAMAIYTNFLALGSVVGGLTGSYIAADMGWRWTHWVGVILSGANLLFVFFLLPETLFDRSKAMEASSPQSLGTEKNGDVETAPVPPASFAPYTYLRSLRIIGINRKDLVGELIRPWLTLRLPGVWMAMLLYGGLVGGIVTIAVVGPQVVSQPPYLWGSNAGLINMAGVIGIILGAIYTFMVADRYFKSKARRSSTGHTEPEARLPTMFPALFLATTGLWVFGFCADNPGPKQWVGLQFGFGMLAFGLIQIPSIAFNYMIDSYYTVSGDCFVMVTSWRAIIAFAWSFFAGTWVQERGAAEPFGIFGMLMGIFALLVVPQWLWGKRTRIATDTWLPKRASH